LLERLQVGGATLLLLELAAQLGLGAFKTAQGFALVAHEHPPRQSDDQQGDQGIQPDLGLARPATDVVEVQFADVDLLAAHDPAPSAASAAVSSATAGSAASASVVPASTAVDSPST